MSKVCSVKPDVKCGTGLLVCTLMNSVQRTGGGAGRGFSGSKPAKYVRQIFILSWLDWPYWQKARSDDRIALFGRSLTPIGRGQKKHDQHGRQSPSSWSVYAHTERQLGSRGVAITGPAPILTLTIRLRLGRFPPRRFWQGRSSGHSALRGHLQRSRR